MDEISWNDRAGLPHSPAVYAILDGEACLYVGATLDLAARISPISHHKLRMILPIERSQIRIRFEKVKRPDLRKNELSWIKKLSPKYNGRTIGRLGEVGLRLEIKEETHRALKFAAASEGAFLIPFIRSVLEEYAAKFIRDSGMKELKKEAK